MTRDKIILGGFEQWVEYNERLCSVIIFGSATAKHGVHLDVFGSKGHKHINNFFINTQNFGSIEHLKLTKEETTQINEYINQKDLVVTN